MISVNGYEVKQETFGDKTLKCDANSLLEYLKYEGGSDTVADQGEINILWHYENDSELFLLYSIVNFLRENFSRLVNINLTMPYIPNARQDRFVSGRLFTLKYFTKFLNSLNFDSVFVFDPHSDVSTALIDNVCEMNFSMEEFYRNSFKDIKKKGDAILFPDTGASKKYKEKVSFFSKDYFTKNTNFIIGNKHRNKEGRIDSYELIDFPETVPETVFIVDDICSYGGTFVSASKALREKGVKNVYLIVSHCEENIFKGDALRELDGVFTTNSILSDAIVNEKDTDKKVTISYRFK